MMMKLCLWATAVVVGVWMVLSLVLGVAVPVAWADPSVAGGAALSEVDTAERPIATPTPAASVAVAPCGPDGMPTDPSQPCMLLVNPLQALNVRVAKLEADNKAIIQAVMQLQQANAAKQNAAPAAKAKAKE